MAAYQPPDPAYNREWWPGKEEILNNIVDYMARKFPQASYAEFPRSTTSYDAGYRKVNYRTFANAINGAAWWLHKTLGPGKDFEALAYIGPNDMRYNILILAAVKAGYKLFTTSPRNSIPAHAKLLKEFNCATMLTASPQPPMIPGILAECQLRLFEVPSLEDFLDIQHPHYPYNKTFEEARHEPLLCFHTSGSTGMPKPITYTHEFAAAAIKAMHMDAPEGYEVQDKLYQANRIFFMLPPFHTANHVGPLFNAITTRATYIYPLAGAIPSAQLLIDGLKHTRADAALLPPVVVAEISRSPEMLEFVANNLDTIVYAGGDVPQGLGDLIASRVKLLITYGSSECTALMGIRPHGTWPKEDWKYTHLHPGGGISFRHYADDLYELYIVRDPDLEANQPVFKLFPDIQDFRTKDLFSAHPSKPNLWRHRGRADDIIVFLTGEKTNPISMENAISSHPEVKSALVSGAQRFQSALIVELLTDQPLSTTQKAKAIERLWPAIEQANQDCPNYAKIAKSHILFCSPDKPMLRAGKGTVQRQPTWDLYKDDLDTLFADGEKISSARFNVDFEPVINVRDYNAVSAFIRQSIMTLTHLTSFGSSDNFFVLGMDSLQALSLTRNLKQATGLSVLAVSTIYANPTMDSLSKAICEVSEQNRKFEAADKRTRQQNIENTIQEYECFIDNIPFHPKLDPDGRQKTHESTSGKDQVVILTGSTGSLGSYMLQVLLSDPTISHVYCLNRAPDSLTLQIQRNLTRHLLTTFPPRKVTFASADFSQPNLGLDYSLYEIIVEAVTTIIHTAWPVNFNIPLSAFRPHLTGLINLIALAASAPHSPSLTFISSVSAVLDYPSQSIPESILPSVLSPLPMGYAESKYISERLLDYAARKPVLNFNHRICIARVGQIAGPMRSKGVWNKNEWIPRLVVSSLYVGAVPDTLGSGKGGSRIDWVPIDLLADALMELVFSEDASLATKEEGLDGARVWHLVNTHPVPWESLLPSVVKSLNRLRPKGPEGKSIEAVPYTTWLQKIRKAAEDFTRQGSHSPKGSKGEEVAVKDLLSTIPALATMAFYESLTQQPQGTSVFETKKTEMASGKLREIGGIGADLMEGWVQGWFV